ncbi:MAG: hypothetical protein ABJE95_19585 [Byssovorax sp.]
MGFKQGREETIARIPWLGNARGIAFEGTLGAEQDAELARLKDAARMSASPFLCPDDALDRMGADFDIERFDGEANGTTTSGYRGRLCAAWTTWQKAGSPQAVIDSLIAYGLLEVAVVQDFEGNYFQGDMYNRFEVRLGPHFGALGFQPLVAPFIPDAEGTITGGSTATLREIQAIKRQILKWKAAHSYPVRVALQFVFGALQTLDDPAPDPDTVCRWDLGKLSIENIQTPPFTPGGFEV